MTKAFRVFLGKHGRPSWWIGRSASGYLARDRKFISTEALKKDVARPGSRGPLLFCHLEGLPLGECMGAVVAGRFLVEYGIFHDTPLAQAAARGLAEFDDVAMSITWHYDDADLIGNVFSNVRIVERSILPRGTEADITTGFHAEASMQLFRDFAKALGIPQEEVEAEIQNAETVTAALDAAGVPSRAAADPAVTPGDKPESQRQDGDAVMTPEEEAAETEAVNEFAQLMALQTQAIIAGVSEAVAATVTAAFAAQPPPAPAPAPTPAPAPEAEEETEAPPARSLEQRIAAIETALTNRSSASEAFLAALVANRASNSPDTELERNPELAGVVESAGTVGVPEHPLDQFNRPA